MPQKSFLVKVELTVQKISCPGVWLCSNGKLSLQLYALDSNIQTESYKPIFPIIFNEKFVFYKKFLKERRLNELHRSLTRECFCAELIQWKNCDEGVVLASFQTTLDDLLYPSSFTSLKLAGTDVDLLLEPTKLFPGTIAPKLELRTKTTIEETFCDLAERSLDKGTMVSKHKISCSNQTSSRRLHPKSVCHTVAYSKAQQRCPKVRKDNRPIFKYRKPEDDLILRTNPENVVKDDIIKRKRDIECVKDENGNVSRRKSSLKEIVTCYCGESGPISVQENTSTSFVKAMKDNRQRSSESRRERCACACGKHHEPNLCPICSKYECTFSLLSTRPTREFLAKRKSSMKLCSYCQENYDMITANCPCQNRDVESPSEKKVCFCLPKERTVSLAQRLHERLISTMGNGATSIENCIRNCEVCE